MSIKDGILKTCDRCGKSTFLERLEKAEGFRVIEDPPEGWGRSADLCADLCPECNKEYRELIVKFEEQGNE